MPCYDGRDSPEELRKEWRHNSPVAEMLCGVLTVLIAEGRVVPDINGLAEWWIEHRARDAARKRADQAALPFIVKIEPLEYTQEGQRVRVTYSDDSTYESMDPQQIQRWYEEAKHTK